MIAGWTSAKLRRRSAAAAHADRRVVAFDPVLNIQDPNVPLPHIQGVADVEELFLSVQLELVQCFRPRLPPKAVELLTVHANDVAQITVPPEDIAEHVVEFGERHVIGDRDQADDHRAHLAQNRSQNQAFEGGCFNHLSRLLGSRPPTFWRSLSTTLPRPDFPETLVSDNSQSVTTRIIGHRPSYVRSLR